MNESASVLLKLQLKYLFWNISKNLRIFNSGTLWLNDDAVERLENTAENKHPLVIRFVGKDNAIVIDDIEYDQTGLHYIVHFEKFHIEIHG